MLMTQNSFVVQRIKSTMMQYENDLETCTFFSSLYNKKIFEELSFIAIVRLLRFPLNLDKLLKKFNGILLLNFIMYVIIYKY